MLYTNILQLLSKSKYRLEQNKPNTSNSVNYGAYYNHVLTG